MTPQPSSLTRLAVELSAHLASLRSQTTPAALQLAEELATCWRRGERVPAEVFLQRHPELWQQTDAALQLVYEEICQRQGRGETDAAAVVLARFPQWKEQLEILIDCHRFLRSDERPLPPPSVGDLLGEFELVAELGRGAVGGVFLALQPALANRPVVLKLTPCSGQEHLSLARVQHTHIVPLYSARDEPGRDLRILCMPYFGGASLARLMELMAEIPPSRRSGRHLVDALQSATRSLPISLSSTGQMSERLARATYVQAVCWIGACLADALHYAHERDLVHLDLKPANVLLAADGTPMLLDFHLARAPVEAGAPPSEWLGGTPLYMAPEQAQALNSLRKGLTVPVRVDAKADVYALGLMLYQLLGGPLPVDVDGSPDLHRHNGQVSLGLADVMHRCLARTPGDRYPTAASLADDLRRHLAELPFRGVRNRSLLERYRKWRRRRPNALVVVVLVLLLGAVAFGVGGLIRQRYRQPTFALREAQVLMERDDLEGAVSVLERAEEQVADLPFTERLTHELSRLGIVARRALAQQRRERAVQELHELAERIRFASVLDPLPVDAQRYLAERCRLVWESRQRLLEESEARIGSADERWRQDLLDVAIIGAGLEVRLASEERLAETRQEVLCRLDEAETLLGPSAWLDQERRLHRQALGLAVAKEVDRVPRTGWEHVNLGRLRLQQGTLEAARKEFVLAIDDNPADFWAHFYRGLCAYRLQRGEEAEQSFAICAALSPRSAACYHNRALARALQGRLEDAEVDYSRALDLDPNLAAAALNRGVLRAQQGRHSEAGRDFTRALANGADPVVAHYHLALSAMEEKDLRTARRSLQSVLERDPMHREARRVLDRLGP